MIRLMQITSGRGPAECQWVVFHLAEQVTAAAKSAGLKTKTIEVIPGDLPGTFKSVLFSIEGETGISEFIERWEGTVQWIGQSMFRKNHKRKNWFVSVETLEPEAGPQFDRNDVKIERMRASGPGGQHVNKTESAVRVTHLQTGLSAISQSERSQHQNIRIAMARLQKLVREQEAAADSRFKQSKWGQHNRMERGNAKNVFQGMDFIRLR